MPTAVDYLTALLKVISDDSKRLTKYDNYHEGEQPLKYMAPALEAELGADVAQVVINWPRMITEAYENRQDVTGFRFTDSAGVVRDQDLWDMFIANAGSYRTQQLNLEKLICGRVYAIVGAGARPSDPPVWTEEHPLQVSAVRDPKTRQIVRAAKHWQDDDTERTKRANLYLKDATLPFVQRQGRWEMDGPARIHNLGRPPVVEFLNRGRMLRSMGVSAFHDAIPLADAANKMATDMMISGDFHAMPRRWALGFGEDEFVDDKGKKVSAWSVIKGRIWSTAKKPGEAELGQFDEADLKNFHDTLKLLAQIAMQLVFVPDEYISFTSINPPSADSQRAGETRFVKRVERQNADTGIGLADVQSLMWRIATGKDDPKARGIQTLWRDPATPTVAQVADAVVKKYQAKIIPREFAQEELGYTLQDRERMKKMFDEEASADPLAALADEFRTQRQPAVEQTNPVLTDAGA